MKSKDLRKKILNPALRLAKNNRLAGFTLIEILISMILLATVTAGIIGAFVAANKFISRSQRRLQAATLATDFLENFNRGVGAELWENAANPLWPLGVPTEIAGSVPADHPLKTNVENLSVIYEVTEPFAGEPMRKVEIIISWDEPN